VLVSHRFSTVLMADLIAVLEHGRLVEFGSHRDLMAMGGLYAELFHLQARAYAWIPPGRVARRGGPRRTRDRGRGLDSCHASHR
jgi:ABC-type multidrug transport system ATPase subunit